MMERGAYRGRGGGSGRNWNNGGRRGGGRGGGQSYQHHDGHNQQQQQPFQFDRYSGEGHNGNQWATSTRGQRGNGAHYVVEDHDPQPNWHEQNQRFHTQGRGRARETRNVDGYGRNYGHGDDGGKVWSKRGGYNKSGNHGGGNGGSSSSDGYGSSSRGRGRSQAAAPQSQLEFRLPPPEDDSWTGSSDPVARDVSSAEDRLKSATKHVPVRRPDEGGKLFIRTARLRVNHFPVDFSRDTIIRHYDIDVKPVAKNSGLTKVSKYDLTMVRDKLCADNPDDFPLSMIAYDGEKNIFTAVPLPSGTFKVEFTEGEQVKHRSFIVTIKHVSDLKLCKLKEYLRGSLTSIPREILQGMDVVMKENPTRNMIQVGRTFHPVESDPRDNLGFGITASRGIKHSLKPTFQGLALCLDYSVLAFRKKMPVIEYLYESIPGFSLQHFRDFRRVVENTLKNLKVNVMHRVTKQKYTIAGLTRENTRHVKFDVEDSNGTKRQVFLVDYFTEKYGRNITCMDIPALDFSKNNRKNYVPMEFCILAEGQIYPKESLDHDVARLLKNMSLADPKERERRICGMVQSEDGPCGGGIIKNFGLEVNKNMTSVNGRILGPPELKLSNPNGGIKKIIVEGEKCQWNMVGKAVVEGKAIQRWALLDFSASEQRSYFRLDHDNFISNLMVKCKNMGMHMERILLRKPARMQALSNVGTLRQLLEDTVYHCNELGRGRLQLLLCAMSDKHEGYKYIKWISETGIGVVTQCLLSKAANNMRGQDQYLTNLALKINAKLGGSNVELIERLPFFKGEGHVMCIGADVNHPGSRNKSSPSIAAVVASVNWPAMNRYAARVRPQDHCKEEILHFGQMCLELVEIYERLTRVKPEKILIFRDGVSEGQFDMVLNKELIDLKIVFEAINYHPTITLIVAQKRHHTRFFLENVKDRGTANVPPGTVVDTIVVHPREFDFYLCSHYGSLGTSKPTHYHVLHDEHFFSSDQLQELIYTMCFTFARCTKPVSLVPPVYYADLVAYRGRAYHDAMTVGQSPSSVSSCSSSASSCASLNERFYKLHSDLENVMYFV